MANTHFITKLTAVHTVQLLAIVVTPAHAVNIAFASIDESSRKKKVRNNIN